MSLNCIIEEELFLSKGLIDVFINNFGFGFELLLMSFGFINIDESCLLFARLGLALITMILGIAVSAKYRIKEVKLCRLTTN